MVVLLTLAACFWPAASAFAQAAGGAAAGARGPDVVVLDQLQKLFDPVVFDHKTHVAMADMKDGCVTCHHHSPKPGETPACRTCHEVSPMRTDMRVPGLKGAYHKQCLDCHKEWSHENGCGKCHAASNGKPRRPTVAELSDRMHPLMDLPREVLMRARFTPADGPNVLFRHQQHAEGFGLRCMSCHSQTSCSSCHDGATATTAPKGPKDPLTARPRVSAVSLTRESWEQTHARCTACHREEKCGHCHYKDGQTAPPAFEHASRTGQVLDQDHSGLACGQCHTTLAFKTDKPTCGNDVAGCHASDQAIAFPARRPGPVVEGHVPGAGG